MDYELAVVGDKAMIKMSSIHRAIQSLSADIDFSDSEGYKAISWMKSVDRRGGRLSNGQAALGSHTVGLSTIWPR